VEQLERGELPACGHRAQVAGTTVLTQDMPTTCAGCPLSQTYAGATAQTVCLAYAGQEYGFLGVSVPARFARDEEERQLLQEIAGDLAFALHTMAREAQSRQSAEALRASQAQFQVLFESGPLAIAVHTADGRFLRCNQAMIDLLGYSPGELATLDPTFPDDRDAGHELYGRMMAGEFGRYQREKRYVCRDGQVIWAQLTATRVCGADDAPQYLMFIIQDITERVRTEAVRTRAEAQLAEQLDELRRWHAVTLGRETRILDLKREVNELLAQTGQPPRYPSVDL